MKRLAFTIVTASALALAACTGSSDDVESSSDDITGAARAHVTRAEGGALGFATPIAARVDACTSGPDACKDADHDGLVDAWEAAVLDRLRPAVTFDEDEPLIKDGSAAFAMLGRVFPGAAGHVVVNILLLYTSDYGAQNPVCFHKSKHAGDVERVALELELDESKGSAGGARVIAAFTTGHEGTEDDQSRVWKGDELGKTLKYINDGATHEPRWQVFPSQNKHATYATIEQCQAVHLKQWTHDFCIDEDCAPDRVRDAARFTRVPAIINAGEPGAPLSDDLAPLGFPSERAWSDDKFCGSLGATLDAEAKKECPPSVKSKLLKNPFAG
jgi:hypothetical protein